MKVIIAGSRCFNDYDLLERSCDEILDEETVIVIVTGKCKGADSLGEVYARERRFPIAEFPADWEKHGRSAGPIRNEQMARYADTLIAFWDGVCSDTNCMASLSPVMMKTS